MSSDRKHLISASAVISASPQRVYSLIADYRNGHPRIVPEQFSGMAVEQGGIGTGTVIRFQLRLLGRKQWFRAAVTEPEPGRLLMETYLDSNGAVTAFTVDPGPNPGQSQVTIATELPVRSGWLGKVEGALSARLLRPIYVEELAILARVAAEPAGVNVLRKQRLA
jgi:hypothetical protein